MVGCFNAGRKDGVRMRREEFMALLNGANRDYGHILCEHKFSFV